MPELPDVVVYLEALERRILGEPLQGVRLASPFLLRSYDPPLDAALGKRVVGLERLGKRLIWGLEGDLYFILHLMIAGRLRWKEGGSAVPKKLGLAAFDFPKGTLLLTEASKKKRASLHLVRGREATLAFDRGGIEVLASDRDAFAEALGRETHTLKRALTDPRLVSGIGNAYSDEILHAARLSPLRLTTQLGSEEMARLHAAAVVTLGSWVERLREESGDGFPEKVTAFREGMAVHGRFGQPCPRCGSPVQRIVYAENECNYCAKCQTEGRILMDRSLSRLLKSDWPRTLEELEEKRKGQRDT